MRRPPTSLPALLLALLLPGCVYYNGMYNAKRLAHDAWKAERDGRPFQAASLWGQVAVKAESVTVRHPSSRWADEAAVLRGIALARLRQCDEALGLLGRTPRSPPRSEVAEEAALALGRCHLQAGRPEAADFAFAQVLESRDPGRRAQARLEHARVLRSAGRYREAFTALQGIGTPAALDERIIALAGAGRRKEALVRADSAVRSADTTRTWDSLLVAVGREDPVAASRVLDLVLTRTRTTPPRRARWLLEDGVRLLPADTARARVRLRQSLAAGRASGTAGEAEVQLLAMDLAAARVPADLRAVLPRLGRASRRFETRGGESASLAATVAAVLAADSTSPGAPQGELRLFLAAEMARDLVGAPKLAATLFRRAALGWPDSPYAAKALLAAGRVDPAWADTAQALLLDRYATSPYLAALRGEEAPEFHQLEDSLRTFASLAAARPAARPATRPARSGAGPRGGVRKAPGEEPDEDRLRRPPARPGQPRSGTRVPDDR